MKLTRRELAAVVSATALSTAGTQAQQAPATPADDFAAARERLKANGDLLAQQQLPMATEPAFQFRA